VIILVLVVGLVVLGLAGLLKVALSKLSTLLRFRRRQMVQSVLKRASELGVDVPVHLQGTLMTYHPSGRQHHFYGSAPRYAIARTSGNVGPLDGSARHAEAVVSKWSRKNLEKWLEENQLGAGR